MRAKWTNDGWVDRHTGEWLVEYSRKMVDE